MKAALPLAIGLLAGQSDLPRGRFSGPAVVVPDEPINQFCKHEPFSMDPRRPAVTYEKDAVTSEAADIYGGKPGKPASIDFDAEQAFSIQPNFPNGPMRLIVSRQDTKTKRFVPVCDTGIMGLKQHIGVRIRVTTPMPGETRWRIQVIEPNLDGDSGEPPNIGLWEPGPRGFRNVTTSPPRLPDYMQVAANPKLSSPSVCPAAQAPANPGAKFIALSEPLTLNDDFTVPQRVRVLGGKRTYWKLSVPAGATLGIALSAKPLGLHADAAVCTRKLAGPATLLVQGQLPWGNRGFKDLWTGALKRVSPGTAPIKAKIQVLGEDTDTSTPFIDVEPIEAPLMCLKETRFVRTRATVTPGPRFKSVQSVRINIIEDGISLSPTAKSSIERAILASFAVWRRACQFCAKEQFSVIGIDDRLFALDRLFDAEGNPFNGGADGLGSGIGPNWNRIPPRGNTFQFASLSLTDEQRSALCARVPRPNDAIDPRTTAICLRDRSGPNALVVNLVVRNRRLNCDPDPNVVACWNGTNLIEVNGRDYRFYLEKPDRALFGIGRRSVDLGRALAHEVGHWHGLNHIESAQSIMRGIFSAAECVGDETVSALNDITNGKTAAHGQAERLIYDR